MHHVLQDFANRSGGTNDHGTLSFQRDAVKCICRGGVFSFQQFFHRFVYPRDPGSPWLTKTENGFMEPNYDLRWGQVMKDTPFILWQYDWILRVIGDIGGSMFRGPTFLRQMHFWFWAQMDPWHGPQKMGIVLGQIQMLILVNFLEVMFFLTLTLFHRSHVLKWNCLVQWQPYRAIPSHCFHWNDCLSKDAPFPIHPDLSNILHPEYVAGGYFLSKETSNITRLEPALGEGNAWTIRLGGCWSCWWTCSFDGQCHWAEIVAMKGWA